MIVLVGETASGKSTVEKLLAGYGYKPIVSYTTRPMRDYEVNGRDYHFIDNDEFSKMKLRGEFLETSVFKESWWYGSLKGDYVTNSVAVLNPHGLRQFNNYMRYNLKGIQHSTHYIRTTERTRLKRLADRGDNLMEVYRRLCSDQGMFVGIEDDVNQVIEAEQLTPKEVAEAVIVYHKKIHRTGYCI